MTTPLPIRTPYRGTLLRPLRSDDRWAAALALVVVAGTHAPLVAGHLREVPYVGWLFVALCTVSLVLAVLVVRSDSVVVWGAAGAVCAATMATYLISRTVGLPGMPDDIGSWAEPLSYPAVVAELVTVWLAVVVLAPRARATGAAGSPSPEAAGPQDLAHSARPGGSAVPAARGR